MDLGRVMEIWSPAGRRVGSGYLVTDRLVLTAYHVVRGTKAGQAVEVRQFDAEGRTSWMTAQLCWPPDPVDLSRHPDGDGALLRITDAAWRPPLTAPVRFGRVTGEQRIPCLALGFPEAVPRDGDRRRDIMPVRGHIDPLHAMRSGMVTIHVDQGIVPRRPARGSGWSGSSGAAVMCGPLLVAVLAVDQDIADTAQVLTAAPVTALLGRDGFRDLLRRDGADVALEDASAAADEKRGEPDVPPGTHNLPAPPPKIFVGRSDALAQLDGSPAQGRTTVVTQTVHGLGGVGKTALALQYAHTRLHRYRLVWWIAADTAESVLDGLAQLARQLTGADYGSLTVAEAADRAVAWLQAHPGWLLVLDNAENPADLHSLLGRLHHAGHVLITSRYREGWSATLVPLPVLDPEDSLRLLIERTGLDSPADRTEAQGLAEDLGHLPLALEQAGAYIAQTRTPIADYRELLRDDPADTFDTPPLGADPDRTVARIWKVTVDAIARNDSLAVRALHTVAWYAPEDIPRDLLAGLAEKPARVARALALLAAYSMINLSTQSVSVHRLVQAVSRTVDPADPHRGEEAVRQAREAAAKALVLAIGSDAQSDSWGWSPQATLQPHVDAYLSYVESEQEDVVTAFLLYCASRFTLSQGQLERALSQAQRSVAVYTRLTGDDIPAALEARSQLAVVHHHARRYDQAIEQMEQIVAQAVRTLGDGHESTITFRSNLANCYRAAGDPDRALPLLKRTLDDRTRLLGEDHPLTLMARSNLADAYAAKGDLTEAIAMYEKTLADQIRLFGEDDVAALPARHNLALAYLEAKDLGRAGAELERLLADRSRLLGDDDPETMRARHTLAGVHEAQGDAAQAAGLHERNLADRRRVLGEDHPDTLSSCHNLAVAHRMARDTTGAIALFQRVLADRTRTLGEDHPDTLNSLAGLAATYRSAGRFDAAIPLFDEILNRRLRSLGPDDPQTLASRNVLGLAHEAVRNLRQAISLYEENLTEALRVLGRDDPEVFEYRHNLADGHRLAGHPHRAITLYEENLADLERVLGEDHDSTLITRNNLAITYNNVDEFPRALALHTQNLAIRARTLGDEHPLTLNSLNNLAHAYEGAGDPDRAIALFEQALAGRTRALGDHHPDTISARRSLEMARRLRGRWV